MSGVSFPAANSVRLQAVTSLAALPFPFTALQEGVREPLTYDALTPSNLPDFKKGVKEWLECSAEARDINYLPEIWYPHLRKCLMPETRFKTPLKHTRKAVLFASTSERVEGFVRLDVTNAMITSRMFIGIAPWNLRSNVAAPAYPELSGDLNRLSFLFALHFAGSKDDSKTIFTINPITERGASFAQRFFHLKNKPNHEAIVMVTKRGIKAYLDGNMRMFYRNVAVDEDPE